MSKRVCIDANDIVEIPNELISETAFPEFLIPVIQKLLKFLPYIFGVSRCSFYRIYTVLDEVWCEIITGIPPTEEHGIGKSWLIKTKKDILRGIGSFEAKVKDDLLFDPDTEHFRDWIVAKDIHAILYSPICEGDLRGLIVVDANGAKKNFTEEEKQVFKETFLELLHGIRECSRQELRDKTINPIHVIGARAKRVAAKIRADPAFTENGSILHEADMLHEEGLTLEGNFS